MTTTLISEQVRGRTIRFAWTEGPTQGSTHEHVFHEDGTVEWHAVEKPSTDAKRPPDANPAATPAERAPYAAERIAGDLCLVSYLSRAGYTLTVVLDFGSLAIVGVVSSDKLWTPVRGRLDVV